jgi:hypothetical protein
MLSIQMTGKAVKNFRLFQTVEAFFSLPEKYITGYLEKENKQVLRKEVFDRYKICISVK